MARRRAGYFAREWRKAKRAMKPNRVGARFISGGKHQTFGSILGSPFKHHTVTSGKNRRKQYQAHKRKQQRAAAAEKRRAQREAAAARRKAAAARKAAPRPPRKPRPKSPPIAVNAWTGKPITYAQAVKALREAEARAERLAAGQPGDPPARRPRKAATKKGAPAPKPRPAARHRKSAAPRVRAPRAAAVPPDPAAAPGKSRRGVYYAATCPCQGTGRIAVFKAGRVSGSTSCPTHGRAARGGRKVLARRAVKNAGLPGAAGWLASRRRGNSDKQQQRASRAAERRRYAGPSEPCRVCDGDGRVNRELTDQCRTHFVSDLIGKLEAQGKRIPSSRRLDAAARRAYPYDLCQTCSGLGRVASAHSGWWHRRTDLPQVHRLTAREAATGKQPRDRPRRA